VVNKGLPAAPINEFGLQIRAPVNPGYSRIRQAFRAIKDTPSDLLQILLEE
jgi:hypothetical protein